MGDLSGILNLVSQNPSILQEVLKRLSNTEGESAPEKEAISSDGKPKQFGDNSPCARRRHLLSGVRPYLGRERSQRLDMALSLLGVLEAFGEGGDGNVR